MRLDFGIRVRCTASNIPIHQTSPETWITENCYWRETPTRLCTRIKSVQIGQRKARIEGFRLPSSSLSLDQQHAKFNLSSRCGKTDVRPVRLGVQAMKGLCDYHGPLFTNPIFEGFGLYWHERYRTWAVIWS